MVKRLSITVVTLALGLLLALQLNTSDQEKTRDTRDVWEIRQDLKKEQQRSVELLREITKYETIENNYSARESVSREKALRETLDELEKEAGLTETSGDGVLLYVSELFDEALLGERVEELSPALLTRLINELNRYGAKEIEIAGYRLSATTPIREVNGETYIDNEPLPPYPFEIKVLTDDPEKLHAKISYSQSVDDFATENVKLSAQVKEDLQLSAYQGHARLKEISPVEGDKGGS
ncbi:DUF881 domain-containing protein [Bacillaceae bacterium SIJ1]|uniref:DUF881 domain-containing protein n=1 Tax=Litoribacterium kuwaitense TaxID=1398745 RepID=UPI0013EB0C81|nr:DUF881 domain-containing protein [Litoribacterium kuwaitense]NGP44339.1 DUF881 domain-containing protein [Litoribacterium kuwaitense]